MPRLKTSLLSLATLGALSFGQILYGQNVNTAGPGTLNYIEGQVNIDGQQLDSQSVGKTQLTNNQSISTENGKAEILLTPGVFLRLGANSTVEMISPSLTKTEVRLVQGRVNVEVDQLYPQNLLLIDVPNGQAHLTKKGLYGFDTGNSTIRVFDGEAQVYPGADLNTNIKPITVKGGRELALDGEPGKTQKFDRDSAKDDLYNWSSLRSQYLGEANANLAESYAASASFYPGWYWAGWPYGYTWLPGSGLYSSPFGYGFYSPYYYRVYGPGFYGSPYGWYGRPYGGSYRGGVVVTRPSGGFSGGVGGFHGGGGFHTGGRR
ncbi:FecR domain-containing protein [Edaphobacter albus]|uniref:FecR domain-containing protein n=1 Tax=Edaphobacter sp. 4G125 TaxID=2763071 RepID=UPI001648B3F5|nr:FecR domain-containing protein [Edaphobacter sp. 4G125]QNI35422.1 FecR domain-containing protein [Edaphobacter sp. 4G125]